MKAKLSRQSQATGNDRRSRADNDDNDDDGDGQGCNPEDPPGALVAPSLPANRPAGRSGFSEKSF